MQPTYSYIYFINTIIFLPLFHHYKLIAGVFFFEVDGSKEVFYKYKVNCVPLKMIINSSEVSVTLCDKWTRWTESVMEGQMWKVSFRNHSAQRSASVFTNWHEIMEVTL